MVLKLIQSPAGKSADRFLFHLSSSDHNYKDYLIKNAQDHPFIDLCKQEGIRAYRVLNSKRTTKDKAIVAIIIEFDIASVQLELGMQREDDIWLVSSLPRLNIYSHAIPIKSSKAEKGMSKWLVETAGGNIEVLVANKASEPLASNIPVSMLTLDGFLVNAKPLSTQILSRVMALTNKVIEDKRLGYLPVKGEFPIYTRDNDDLVYMGNFSLPPGTGDVTLYSTEDGIGRMAVFDKYQPLSDKIRVGLSGNEQQGLIHESTRITCTQSFSVSSPISSINLTFNGGDIIDFKPLEHELAIYKQGQHIASSMFRWYIKAEDQALLNVLSISKDHRMEGTGTEYNGILELAPYEEGLVLVNETDLEEYLKAVVPSEMPVQFGLEALKVQAVCARAYAVRAMQSAGYRAYGLHLDDSTNSQVYNNTATEEIASHAVDETRGLVPYYNDEVVDTRYFSTSSGYTANYNEVWSSKNKEFPSDKIPYLVARPQYPGNATSLYNQENIKSFIDNTGLPAYDKFSPFFRWCLSFTPDQLEASISQNLKAIFCEQPEFVLTRTSENTYRSMDIPEQVGKLLNIEVIERGEGGNIMQLEIATTHGVYKIIKEYNIRRVLKPVNYLPNKGPIEIVCHDNSLALDFPLLPSAFAYIDFKRDYEGNILDIRVAGGGYGHGVGMSQYGAYGLTLVGRNFSEIIGHYYPGSRLENINNR
ncbi:MAG TPA: SpoIID/LytB domain-containing protein [Bacillota bacterium]|nr:SpoIID/LytB domain-containing protein [Bacillota bacterium]